MDEDLKDLINTVEEETKTRAVLEAEINSLKEDVNRLKFTIREQHLLIEEQGDQISFAQSDLPSEINILKEMITSQRRDLGKRDNNIDLLNNKLDELTNQMGKAKDSSGEVHKNDLFEAQELILKLSQESEEYRNHIEVLKNQLESIEKEKSALNETNVAQTEENEEMVNIKRLNFQLMEQNGILRIEIESLKAKINDRISEENSEVLALANEKIEELNSEVLSLKTQIQEQTEKVSIEELELANKKIEDLVLQIEDYDTQLKFLQKELEKIVEPAIISTEDALKFAELREAYEQQKFELVETQSENTELRKLISEIEDYEAQLEILQGELQKAEEPPIIPTEDALKFAELREEYDQMTSSLVKYEKENEDLKKKLVELNSIQQETIDKDIPTSSVAYDFPNHFQISLFKKMYKLLDEDNKKAVINTLINDLNSKNNEVKRTAIRILSEIKDKKVYETFIELVHDEDWLIRYNLIKALSKFDFETEEFKELLKKLSRDADVDVRELAVKMLSEISK
ncbi:MAG: HEAT repeat domain-containing protein [Candidatus Lokiarchaeota archaeon]|nr:HEAT repeat domain-containing protein [Candidatus Lokiarchaeota archaeon]